MVDVAKAIFLEQAVNKLLVEDRTLDKSCTFRDVVGESAAQVVQYDDLVAKPQKVIGNMGSHETSTTSDQ